MYEVRIQRESAWIDFVLAGAVTLEEMRSFIDELEAATVSLKGLPIKIRADVRDLHPANAEVAQMIQSIQTFGLGCGVHRVAEVVESDTLAQQLNALAQQSGTDAILRRFWDEDSARDWLFEASSAPAASGVPDAPRSMPNT
jgi:hypothetical protein